jgi:hypothetical protein
MALEFTDQGWPNPCSGRGMAHPVCISPPCRRPRPTMRWELILAGSLLCGGMVGCTTPRSPRVEVAAAEHWVVTDSNGRHEYHCRYKPFVVAQGRPFMLDFSRPDSFQSPDTGRRERYSDGVRTRMTVTLSNTTAYVEGRCDYVTHLGVVRSYYEDNEALYAHDIRHYSTRFTGMTSLDHELRIPVGEDENDEPSVCVTFRETTAKVSRFTAETLDDGQ